MSCFFVESPAFSEKMSCFYNNPSGNPNHKSLDKPDDMHKLLDR